jgi:16S rRNA G966 N2-methylase RsmD
MTQANRIKSNTAYNLLKKAKSKLGVYILPPYETLQEEKAIKALDKLSKEFGKSKGSTMWENSPNYYNTKAYWIKNISIVDRSLTQRTLNARDIYIIESAHTAGAINDDTVIKALKSFNKVSLWDKIKSLFNF